jgi:hypothetical protein
MFRWIPALAAVLLLTGCVHEETVQDDNYDTGRVPVRFSAGIDVETRVSNPEGNQWDAADTIGIYMIRAGGTLSDTEIREGAKNKPYAVASGAGSGSASFAPAADVVYYPNGEDVNFIAYYPYGDAPTVSAGYTYRMDISNQNVPARLDLLYSNNKAVYNSKVHDANLSFEHLMTKLVFNAVLTPGNSASLANLQMEIQNVNTLADFDLATGVTSSDGAGQRLIVPFSRYVSADSVRMEAILIPTADASGIRLVFSLNGKSYASPLPVGTTGVALQKGKCYIYRVLFDESEVKIDGTLTGWDEIPDDVTPPPTPDPDPSLPSVHIAGYRGQATLHFASGGQEVLALNGNGKAGLTTQSGELIRSVTLDNAANNAPILIGRKAEDVLPLSLRVDANGNLLLRDAVNGYIPIASYAEFQLINDPANLGKKYKQETAIDLMSEEWAQIGTHTPSAPFTGEYDGGEYEITNLKIDGNNFCVGFFGFAINATLRNIRLVSGTVNGLSAVGGICGGADGSSSITNCYSGVAVTGTENHIGGICGILWGSSTITSCRNTGNVKGSSISNNIGGITGVFDGVDIKIKDCSNQGEVEGATFTGGIVGFLIQRTAEISACLNSGIVKSTGGYSGGIVGVSAGSITLTVTACYNTGTLENNGNGYTGGIVGVVDSTASTITGCYSTGTVTGSNQSLIGLICGRNAGKINFCYWTKGSSTATQGVGTDTGTSYTYEFSASAWPVSNMPGWGIGDDSTVNTYWKSLGGWNGGTPDYPVLWWE